MLLGQIRAWPWTLGAQATEPKGKGVYSSICRGKGLQTLYKIIVYVKTKT